MNQFIFNFGMKHRESRNKLLRLAAKLCVKEGKREADRVEKKLSKQNIGSMDTTDSKKILNHIVKKG